MKSFLKPLLSRSLLIGLFVFALASTASAADEAFIWAPSLNVGDTLPAISAVDQDGNEHSLAQLSGENGLILVMSRSFDWCPFCIRQLQQLVEAEAQFNAIGFNVTTMTYDSVATLKEAEEEYETTFPMLYDEDSAHIKAMGILNMQYEPGNRAYGIPYPGIFVLDNKGVIRAKLAEEDYRIRPDFSLVLEAAQAVE